MHQPQQVGQQEHHEEVQEYYQALVANIIHSHREPVWQAVQVACQRQHRHSHAGGLHPHQRPPQPQHRRQHPQMPPHIARQGNDNEQNSQHHISSFFALGTKSTTVSAPTAPATGTMYKCFITPLITVLSAKLSTKTGCKDTTFCRHRKDLFKKHTQCIPSDPSPTPLRPLSDKKPLNNR